MSLSGEIRALKDAIIDNGGVLVQGVVATAADLAITAASAKDIIMTLGANDTSKKLSIKDSDGVEVAKIDGNGLITSAAGLAGPVTGNITTNAITPSADLTVTAYTAKDVIVKLGDHAGAKKLYIKDDANAEMASIDSDGTATFKKLVAPVTYVTTDTSGAPTNAECVSGFGAAASVGAGFIGIYQDSHESGKSYICVSNGATYSVAELTAAA